MTAGPERIHKTVLLKEVVDWLDPKPGRRYLDGTLGMGGHSLGLLEAAAGKIELLGLDRDMQALELAEERLKDFSDQVHLMHMPFSRFENALDELGWEGVDGAVLDLGVSSLQLDRPERGFTFSKDGPLDMRMDPSGGMDPARVLVNRWRASELKRIIKQYGDEPLAGKIANAIVYKRKKKEIRTTLQLAEIVSLAYPPKRRRLARNHPATRTFMALRIAVNRETEELENFLKDIVRHLKPGARLAIISFHSLEDRLVKWAFRKEAKGCVCPDEQMVCTCDGKPRLKILTKKPQIPTDLEMSENPRSTSAKLRVAERIGDGEEAA